LNYYGVASRKAKIEKKPSRCREKAGSVLIVRRIVAASRSQQADRRGPERLARFRQLLGDNTSLDRVWRELNERGDRPAPQPNRAIASQPSPAARLAQFSEELKKFLQSPTNWRQRCRGTSLGGRSESRQATPWTQSTGIVPRRSRAVPESVLSEPSLCRGNCHRH
jgi:hypothetical protein